MDASEVLSFWFEELEPADWWRKNPELDRQIGERFGSLHQRVAQMELWSWRDKAEGRLAEIIVLDQFSRNMYRGDPRAFAQDPAALALAQEAVRLGADQDLPIERRSFLYMPYMHSESRVVHKVSLKLFEHHGPSFAAAKSHAKIIEEFGRYPHRNDILGRASTSAEKMFLTQPGSSF